MFIADQSYYPMHHWCMVTSELVTIHEHEWLIHLYFAMPMFGLHHLKEASPLFLQDRGRAHGGVQAWFLRLPSAELSATTQQSTQEAPDVSGVLASILGSSPAAETFRTCQSS